MQMLDRLDDQRFGLAPGAFRPEQSNEGDLALCGILAQGLAGLLLIATAVEQIVGDLERKALLLPIAAELRAWARSPPIRGPSPKQVPS